MNSTPFNNATEPVLPPVVNYAANLGATIYFSVLVLLILVFNGLVITAFCSRPKLRTKQNIFLISLSVADLCIGLFVIPLYTALLWGIYLPAVMKFYFFVDVTLGVAAIFSLTAVTLERCYAILRPVQHRVKRQRGAIAAGLLVTWSSAFLAGGLNTFNTVLWNENLHTFTAVFYCVPLLIIITSYTVIFKVVRRALKTRRTAKGNRRFKQDTKAAVTVAAVTGLFLVCWLPLFMVSMIHVYCDSAWCMFVYDPVVVVLTKCLQYTHSVSDPLTYGIRNHEFRRSFKLILSQLFCRKGVDGEGSIFPDFSNYSFNFSRRSRIYVIPRRGSNGSFHNSRASKRQSAAPAEAQPEPLSIRHISSSPQPSPALNHCMRQTAI